MPIIISIIIAMFFVLLSWTWHNLGEINQTKKVVTIIIMILLMYVITLIIFNISKTDINYATQEGMEIVKNILVILFTIINSLITMPFIAKILNNIYLNNIEYSSARKGFIIIFAIFIIILFFECGYLKNIQEGIIDIYASAGGK